MEPEEPPVVPEPEGGDPACWVGPGLPGVRAAQRAAALGPVRRVRGALGRRLMHMFAAS